MAPERKLYQKIKKHFNEFSLIRLENLSLSGTPDLLVYNNNRHFFTVELKVTKGNKLTFSPHQIAFHVKHPENTFIIAEALGPCSSKLVERNIYLYRGSCITELVAQGLKLEPCCLGLEACASFLSKLGT
tara:strand:- start:15 stop:404 length:390 start_codon:yes stop_codon:yes gene_type:complete